MPAYNFGSTARKHDQLENKGYQRRIEVVAGGAREPKPQTVPPAVATAVKAIIVCVTAIAIIGALRVTLSSATIAAALEAQELSSAISEARSAGNHLEVEQSTLSNPTRIKEESGKLGMSAPESTAFIDLSDDVVVTDANGSSSLTGSLAAAASA